MSKPRIGIIHAYPSRDLLDQLDAQACSVVLIGNANGLEGHPSLEAVLSVPLWSFDDVRKIVSEYHKDYPFDALLPINEGTVVITAQLSEAFGLRSLPATAALASRNKYLAYLLWESQGISVPNTLPLTEFNDAWPIINSAFGGRAVIKLVDSMNSQGVIAVSSEIECREAIHTLLDMVGQTQDIDASLDRNRFAYGRSSLKLMVQEFCEGIEVSVDLFLLPNGEARVLAILEKAPARGPYFAESASFWPTSLGEEAESELGHLAIAAARALGLREGPAHVEIRYADGRPYVLEAGLRPGGGYTVQTIEMLGGQQVYAMQARLGLGLDLPSATYDRHPAVLFGGIVIEKSGILLKIVGMEIFEQLVSLKHLVVLCQEGSRVQAMPRSAQPHFCYYLLVGNSATQLIATHKRIQEQVRLQIEPQET